MPPINLSGLYPQAYEHPEDKAALNALQHTAGLDMLVRKVNSWGMERMLRVQLTGSFLHVTRDTLPGLYDLLETARDRIALPITPEFYIRNAGEINAYTAGVCQPVVVVHSSAVDQLNEEELLFLIGHELGHVKSGHVLYYQLASYLPMIGQIIGNMTLGLGAFFSLGLQVALLHWQRTSELTADRAGLLACQNPDTVLRAMMKLAGIPKMYAEMTDVKHFVRQAQAFENYDASTADRVAKYLSIYGSTHPWTVMRGKEILKWIETGGYDAILNMPHDEALPAAEAMRRFCDECGTEGLSTDVFCRDCGNKLAAMPV